MGKIKFTQISAVGDYEKPILYGLDSRGRVWVNTSPTADSIGMWELIEQPETDEDRVQAISLD